MTVEKHFEQLLDQNTITIDTDRKTYENTRCYILNSLVDIFFSLCKYNQKNWKIPQVAADANDEMNFTLTLDTKSSRSNNFKLNLHRLNKYSSILVINLLAVRSKSLAKSQLNIGEMIYKLKTIKSYVEVFVTVSPLARSIDTLNDDQLFCPIGPFGPVVLC